MDMSAKNDVVRALPHARAIRDAAWPAGVIVGDADRVSNSASGLGTLEPKCLSFVSRPLTEAEVASAGSRFDDVTLVCEEAAVEALQTLPNATLIVVANARLAFIRAVERFFAPKRVKAGIHPAAAIDDSAKIDPTAAIGPFCWVGPGCVIGPDCVLGPSVSLIEDIVLGARVVIAGGTVVGADGFGFERNEANILEKFPHLSGVVIEDDVEIGANNTIDRGTLNPTRIGARTKFDDQVHVAHNVVIGTDVAIAAQAMIAGSVKIGNRAWIGPSAMIMNKVTIGADVTVGLGAVVIKSVPDGITVMGSPAEPNNEFRRARAALKKLANDVE
ncbi:UDP-3-O-(3-hydroxymyristoyl)glucosamine N-acyltransferase [Sphingomonas hankookensis]|uniref:UDP-3-O-(3-hydroxymyristoyl)glucosamine N-acyltransferase n=1 Tax=Sphingomonas hankookensis TaxID=563996 RepID=UPI00234E6C45|nr:UDP-3-O-(3-hydroxymyristoyl)glucosamine N-acyltransferase [Sphingomonas hankookensis]WCP73956.1 UDP-3-O-(3-hydroxymyristoyl)glucosamine N-acyltransferase [Sphingomonas hankookensis]